MYRHTKQRAQHRHFVPPKKKSYARVVIILALIFIALVILAAAYSRTAFVPVSPDQFVPEFPAEPVPGLATEPVAKSPAESVTEFMPITEAQATEIPVRESKTEKQSPLRAVYMTACTAASEPTRTRLLDTVVNATDINAVVIDVKSASGYISYDGTDPVISSYRSYRGGCRILDLPDFLKQLSDAGVYTVARIPVFQDALMAKLFPEEAVRSKSNGGLWYDNRGLPFMDPSSTIQRDYIKRIAIEVTTMGFDEVNLDYVRFPTDGPLRDAAYPISGTTKKTTVMKDFFEYMNQELRVTNNIIVSADVFGLATTTGDIGIGQTFESIAPYVDYIAPMIYPSHYGTGTLGFTNPAQYPAEIVAFATSGAIAKLDELDLPRDRYRPWIQDFDMGATYDREKVRAQIDALAEQGIHSWYVWDPANEYTPDAFAGVDTAAEVTQ